MVPDHEVSDDIVLIKVYNWVNQEDSLIFDLNVHVVYCK